MKRNTADTRNVESIHLDETRLDTAVRTWLRQETFRIFADAQSLIPELSMLEKRETPDAIRYIRLGNPSAYFDLSTGRVFPDPATYLAGEERGLDFNGLKGRAMASKDFEAEGIERRDLPLACSGRIIYVNRAATSGGNGKNWKQAFTDFAQAMKEARAGDQVWVAAGEYLGNNFSLKDGVAVYGGFAGHESAGWQRNIGKNQTVFVGNGENVFLNRDIGNTAILSGVTITNPAGRGMWNERSSPIIHSCTFSACSSSTNWGGGMGNSESSPILLFCTFTGNTVPDYGGAVHNQKNSEPFFYSCSFSKNRALNSNGYGGAIYTQESNPSLIDCRFADNAASRGPTIDASESWRWCSYRKQVSPSSLATYGSSPTIVKFEDLPLSFRRLVSQEDRTIPCFQFLPPGTSSLEIARAWLSSGLVAVTGMDSKDSCIIAPYLIQEDSSFTFDLDELALDISSGIFCCKIGETRLDLKAAQKAFQSGPAGPEIDPSILYDDLLRCESLRADLEPYDPKILTDPNRGHWDLWEEAEPDGTEVRLTQPLTARNPRADIRDGGIIGIDFGTKSTVVVYQESSEHTMAMRIGVGHYGKKAEARHYENPTVVEFKDAAGFMGCYRRREGRPPTLYEQITVSHTAFQSLLQSNAEHYYSVFAELKQWAGEKDRHIRLKDGKGLHFDLPPFPAVDGSELLNPIEIYAYYIGLSINNMYNGIYLDYLLSFPVTYEREVREKILRSFEAGIRKSLPQDLVRDSEVMGRFRVKQGSGEPAAYALCALQEYGFEPEGDQRVFYAIFDFGGGTTDFDFGLWREAAEEEADRYDYVIEHFASGGDRYLGGENLLEYLAFEVFKGNSDALRDKDISFILPPECRPFPGSEALLKNSQEAELNTRRLMEELRPLWERHPDFEKKYESGRLTVNLSDDQGASLPGFELNIDREHLEAHIEERIERGITNFFQALRNAFEYPDSGIADHVSIFLAGNSCRSPVVKELFERHIQEVSKAIQEKRGPGEYFALFPALGSPEAEAIQRERGREPAGEDEVRPTGKTGVAFGLVRSRPGGRIKVVDRDTTAEHEAPFQYYLGSNRKGKFFPKIERNLVYGTWYQFIDAGEEDFEVYYTHEPLATTRTMPIADAKRIKLRLATTIPGGHVYLRAIKPTVIEYVAATEAEIRSGHFQAEPCRVELG